MMLPTESPRGWHNLTRLSILWLCLLCLASLAIGTSEQAPLANDDLPEPFTVASPPPTLDAFFSALDVLQEDYFTIWQGIWPTSIDWTSAVIGTYIAGALTTISTSFSSISANNKANENLINTYFSQLVGSYFGQDAFALRNEAYDDMLWVVLGWLESIKFIDLHSELHYGAKEMGEGGSWYGQQYIPAFAHRARIFWDLASAGWDTTLCGGGMIWSPYLTPYKNAITNELFIAASISMYLYFPGDTNTSPFGFSTPSGANGGASMGNLERDLGTDYPAGKRHNPKYLSAALEAYTWLVGSNMTDALGLYVDGYHISGYTKGQPANSTANKCDERDEMVYTYNQGVLLSGQRGLYEATGARNFLVDGHSLVKDVIAATGWPNYGPGAGGELGPWAGLGRSGVLEELCDSTPDGCSQDAQTFKGIFFHHLTAFCLPLPELTIPPSDLFLGKSWSSERGDWNADRLWHESECKNYSSWISHNALAALSTRDSKGKFGTWWNSPAGQNSSDAPLPPLPLNAVDYRNQGVPWAWEGVTRVSVGQADDSSQAGEDIKLEMRSAKGRFGILDLNDRGRGRTVETQGGGVSVLRAAWEIGGHGGL